MYTVVLSCLSQAGMVFDFTYTGDSHRASGSLTATDNGDGSFTATFGTGQFDGFAITLIPNSIAPHTAYSPTGYFFFDNQLFPAGNPLLLNGGLLFSINTGSATELNIYSNGPYPANPYTSYLNNGNWDNGVFTLTQESITTLGGTATVPEPTTVSFVLTTCIAFFLIHRRRNRSRQNVMPSSSRTAVRCPAESAR
jgi:hypothetical protein